MRKLAEKHLKLAAIDSLTNTRLGKECPDIQVLLSEGKVRLLKPIYFVTNRAIVKKQSEPMLEQVVHAFTVIAEVVEEHGKELELERLTYEIAGHTHVKPSDDPRKKGTMLLSLGRARAVMDVLVKDGACVRDLSCRGYGGTKPVGTPEQNRRVEINVRDDDIKDDLTDSEDEDADTNTVQSACDSLGAQDAPATATPAKEQEALATAKKKAHLAKKELYMRKLAEKHLKLAAIDSLTNTRLGKECPDIQVLLSEGKVRLLKPIYFVTNRAIVKKQSEPMLEQVVHAFTVIAEVVEEHGKELELERLTYEIAGHTHVKPSDDPRKKGTMLLSLGRARAVMDVLVKDGACVRDLSCRGYGGTKPVGTPEQNRRVEINVRDDDIKDDLTDSEDEDADTNTVQSVCDNLGAQDAPANATSAKEQASTLVDRRLSANRSKVTTQAKVSTKVKARTNEARKHDCSLPKWKE